MDTRKTSLNLPLPLQFLAAWIGVWGMTGSKVITRMWPKRERSFVARGWVVF